MCHKKFHEHRRSNTSLSGLTASRLQHDIGLRAFRRFCRSFNPDAKTAIRRPAEDYLGRIPKVSQVPEGYYRYRWNSPPSNPPQTESASNGTRLHRIRLKQNPPPSNPPPTDSPRTDPLPTDLPRRR